MTRGWKISLLAAVVLVTVAGTAQAQRWGRGGGNRSGFSVGIGNFGYSNYGYGNNWGYGGYGGYGRGGYYSPWGYGYNGYYPSGAGGYYGYANTPGYYGNNYAYGYTYPQNSAYSSGYPSTNGYYTQPGYGYYYGSMDQNQQYQVQQAQATQPMNQGDQMGMKARLRVTMPAPDARLTINGAQMQQTGTDRVFESPPLEPNKSYTYTLQATWMDNGREVTRQQEVNVQPGQEAVAVFHSDMGGTRTDSMYQNPQGGVVPGTRTDVNVDTRRDNANPNNRNNDANRGNDQPRNDQPRDDQQRNDANNNQGGNNNRPPE